jgi:hypothetical protein
MDLTTYPGEVKAAVVACSAERRTFGFPSKGGVWLVDCGARIGRM